MQAATAKARTGSSRPDRPRQRASRRQIAEAALEIADREGLPALTMRRVAEALGVGTMTLYGHVRGKQELLDAVVDAAVGNDDLPPLSDDWREALRQLAQAAYGNLQAHPALVQIRFAAPVVRPEALRFGEAGMGILHRAGFDSGQAACAFRLLFTYVFGFAGLSPTATLDDARRQTAAAVAGLPPEDYPNLTQAASEFSDAIGGDEAFAYGLERILDGLQGQLDGRAGVPGARLDGP